MAAILAPSPHHPIDRRRRPHLQVLPGGAAGRPAVAPSPYLRRRLVALVVATTLLALAVLGARALLAPLAEPAAAAPVGAVASGTAVVVQPGDTFWSIARAAQPTGDIRPLVDRLAAAHGPGPLRAGETILVPR